VTRTVNAKHRRDLFKCDPIYCAYTPGSSAFNNDERKKLSSAVTGLFYLNSAMKMVSLEEVSREGNKHGRRCYLSQY
jgi:hypothetical protein